MTNIYSKKEGGYITGAVVTSIIFGLLALVFGSVMIWALVNYNDQKNNVDQKLENARKAAVISQKAIDAKDFEEKEKTPEKEFVGPTDLGRVNFKYPKNWSVYVANDGSQSGSGYQAYFHPDEVPPTTTGSNKFALQVSVLNQSYDQVLQQYQGQVKQGALKSSVLTANGYDGTRFDGRFTKEVNGSAAVFKIRDKTLVLKTDSDTFKPDFDSKILKTLTFQL